MMTAAWWKTYKEVLMLKARKRGLTITLKPTTCDLDPDIWVRDQHGATTVFAMGRRVQNAK